ncbi:MAG: hypothetical protein FJ090_16165, partial [Deltaproteobacteria bacterium]|nr:hypothetical protein [Deltaproteobacteria bacterium]
SFVVTAAHGDDKRRFACVAPGIAEAAALAVSALAARADGPWRVVKVRDAMEALGG